MSQTCQRKCSLQCGLQCGLQGVACLWSKAFDVLLLSVELCLRDKHGEVAVLHTKLLDPRVEELRDGLPEAKRPWAQDVAP